MRFIYLLKNTRSLAFYLLKETFLWRVGLRIEDALAGLAGWDVHAWCLF